MPKLWDDTIASHRRTVHDAIIDATAGLVAEHGLAAVTMSQIADASGVGRATLYRYFTDVESIVTAWHERHVARHLARLGEVRAAHPDPAGRLEAVLEAYARISVERSAHDGPHRHARRHHHDQPSARHHPPSAVATLVHRQEHIRGAQDRLLEFFRELIADAARAGVVRDDVPAAELAQYCLSALAAAAEMPGETAVRRLIAVTLAGLRRPRAATRARRKRGRRPS